MPDAAPFFDDLTDAPKGSCTYWLTAQDATRIRVGLFPAKNARGTLFLFTGRTEYIEKYGNTAADFAKLGYTTFAIDWRGQGLSDRLIDDGRTGHVINFSDYQLDVDAMQSAAEELDLPRPWFVLGHSMGGCIALRAAMRNIGFDGFVFSGPMWGIKMAPYIRPIAWAVSTSSMWVGQSHRHTPTTSYKSAVLADPFEGNKLTNDPEMYAYMQHQMEARPELGLGGPSLRWLNRALVETLELHNAKSPDVPCLTWLGSDEDIVDERRVHDRMDRWPGGRLEVVENGRHEILMDTPEMRGHMIDETVDFMDKAVR